jgi:amidase
MRFEEYRRYDAVALADLVGKGEVSAGELLDVAIARAEAVNPKINAIVHKQYEQARATIGKGLLNGPLAGVPYLIKDLAIFEAGEPARLGSSLYADFIADHDSSYTARCKRAGLVIMGRSSTPEFGISPSTEPRLFGPCRNPWNLAHSAGGSSGGAAAAVAAGILPVAHATDGGARSAFQRHSVGCWASSPPADACRSDPMLVRVGAGCRLLTWYVGAYATALSCSTAPLARNRAIPTRHHRRSTPSWRRSSVRLDG